MTDHPDHIQDMVDDFTFLGDWEERYMHVIEMGKALAPLMEGERNEATRVKGCASQVWLVSEAADGDDPIMTYRGDSDAFIVKGLIAVALKIYSGRRASEITATKARPIFDSLDLSGHLSAQRANGLGAMVERIQRDAAMRASK
ncbi:SufE family protein [Robiginitomaculum antarcticum]|uniref:SufE family protein n=1 Tax=Robiginitomaculum antarcticum TaxID=437507 RepID=UPI000376B5FB|nr:SufE family protein [Robiginitomaculum antarcticum]